mgnify:CR=1 FL=1|tara:strand:+ start:82003 stop:82641 length:639 start_codon:yes stop_codon:yes gene_type:complete
MDGENRDNDKKIHILPPQGTKAPRLIKREGVSLDIIKSMYIASGMNPDEIALQTCQPLEKIQEIINTHDLVELRKAYIIEGISKIQSTQLQQSHKLMDIENDFKKLRIIQLENELENYLAYFARWQDFYKRHPVTGDILKNSDNIPMQIKLPNVAKELSQLKESVTMSEGVRQLLHRLDEIINSGRPEEVIDNDIIDVATLDMSAYLNNGDN